MNPLKPKKLTILKRTQQIINNNYNHLYKVNKKASSQSPLKPR